MPFDRDAYIDSVIAEAEILDDERFECAQCGAEVSSWELPSEFKRPLDVEAFRADLCPFCWADWAANVFEAIEADGGARESLGHA